jgi:vitamin B12 transporter
VSYSRTSRYLSRFFTLLLSLAAASAWAAPGDNAVSGVVVDPGGRPVPRAHVRVLDAGGNETASTFTDDEGRFHLDASGTCKVEAALAGFEAATLPCSTGAMRLMLALAPVQETVIVTATGTETPASQAGASNSVFTAADLDVRREPFVSDLLRSTPGAMVVGTGAPGGVTSLFVRGGDSDYNKVLLDGIPLNEPGGTFNFSNLSTDNLDRVEIVRGAQSALYGSDAMASVVQLFTKRADASDPHPHASATIEGGSFDTVNASTTVSGANGQLDYMLGATRFDTDNQVPNDKFTNSSLTANIGINLGHGATLRAIGRAELEHTGVPGQTAFGRPDLDAFFERHDGVGGVTFDQRVSPSFHERASYSLSVSNQVSTNLVLDPPFTAQYQGHVAPYVSTDFLYDSTTNLQRHYANYQADVKLRRFANADHLLTILADWNGERIHLVDRMAVTDSRESRNNFGAAIQEQALWSRVFVTAGGRVEHNESFGTAAVPRASAVFVAHQGRGHFGDTNLRASAGLGIKEPKAIESFSLSPYYLGNPNLLPERSRSFEFGVDQRFAGDRAKLQATWFDNRFHDQIALSAPDENFFSHYINVGETRARGAEVGLELVPAPMLHVRSGYTFLDSSVIASTSPTNPLFVPGSQLFRRPRHSGFVGVTITRDRVVLDVNGVLVHSYADSDFESFVPPITQNPGYTAWNGRVSYKVSRQVSLLGSMDNIGNASYMEPLGYPALGRAGRLGVRVGF